MRKIILPQAIKNILPALCSEFVTVIKETSIVSIFGLADIYYAATKIGSATYKYDTSLYIGGLLYLIMTFTLSKGIGVLERRLKRVD